MAIVPVSSPPFAAPTAHAAVVLPVAANDSNTAFVLSAAYPASMLIVADSPTVESVSQESSVPVLGTGVQEATLVTT